MPSSTTQHLLHSLNAYKLLTPPQFAEVLRGPSSQDPGQLVQVLVKRGWLTAYQAKHLAAGTVQELLLDPYVLLQPLGEGGMGVVFKARHSVMNRVVALKIVRKELLSRPNAVRRFEREIEAAGRLSHPNIVIAHDAAEKDGRHYFVMEYIEGVDLTKLVRRRGPLPVREACEYVRQASLGLQHAHDCGLVHRDIKPSNLMLTKGPGGQGVVVKILDLGLALLQHDDSERQVTQEGAVMGSPDYIAPEQAVDAHRADIRSDIYSLGCTMYHLLAGQPPFAGGSLAMKIAGHLHGEPPLLEKKRPDVPRYLILGVRKMMMKNPEQRFQTPLEISLTLEHVMKTMRPEAVPELPVLLPDEPVASAEEEAGSGVTATEGPTAPAPPRAVPLQAPREAIAVAPTLLPPRKPEPAVPLAVPFASLSSAATVPSAVAPVPVAPGATVASVPVAVVPGATVVSAAVASVPLAPVPAALAPVAALLPDGTDVGAVSVLPSIAPSLAPVEATPTMPPVATLWSAPRQESASKRRWQDPRWLVPTAFVILVLLSLPLLLGRPPRKPTFRELPVELAKDARLPWYPKELVAVLGEDRGRHWGAVRSVSASADGKLIVSGGDDGIIRLWETPLLREKDRIMEGKGGHKGPVSGVALSPDGRYLLSCGQDRTVRLWDLPTLKEIRQFAGHGSAVAVRFSPDSRYALTSVNGVTWKGYQVQTGAFSHDPTAVGVTATVHRSADDCWMITGDPPPTKNDKSDPPPLAPLQLWETRDGAKKLAQTFKGHTGAFDCVAYTHATRRAFSSSIDGTARLWDAVNGQEIRRLVELKGRVYSAAFSPDGRRLLTASDDALLKTWDALTGKEVAIFDVHRGRVTSQVFLPNNVHIITASDDCTLRLWHLDTGKELHPLGGHARSVESVAMAPDGRRVLSGGSDSTVRLWELRGGREVQQEVHRFSGQVSGVPFVGFLSDDRRLFSVDGAGTTRQWDIETSQVKFTFPWPKVARPTVIALSPDTRRILTGGPPVLDLFDLSTGGQIGSYDNHLGATHCAAFSADGKRILSGGQDWSVRLWDVESKQELNRFAGHTQTVLGVIFARDGQHLYSTSLDATVAHWELKGKSPKKRLELEGGLPPAVSSTAFSPDAALLACSGQEGHVVLWDVATGKLRNSWKMPGAVHRLGWATDSRHLATANANGTVYVYRLDAGDDKPVK